MLVSMLSVPVEPLGNSCLEPALTLGPPCLFEPRGLSDALSSDVLLEKTKTCHVSSAPCQSVLLGSGQTVTV